jgi:shikimate dehydrogenase
MRLFGLIGFPLTHSFSKGYFTEKFEKEGITDSVYENFEIPSISNLPQVIKFNPELVGLNVTIPYKKEVMGYMNHLDESAEIVGAVNVIKVGIDKKLIGYNSDYYGFMESLKLFLPKNHAGIEALVLGTGGAARAVEAVLKSLKIPYKLVSRERKVSAMLYEEVNENVLKHHQLIINTSPLGMYPKTETCPPLNYEAISSKHFLFDLVYNPETTLFMKKGLEKKAKVKNGLEMLHLQAEKAWEIWNKKD